MTQTHMKYLETKLIRRGLDARRAEIINKLATRLPQISKADSEAEETSLDRILTILPVVGIRAFELPLLCGPRTQVKAIHFLLFSIEHEGLGAKVATPKWDSYC